MPALAEVDRAAITDAASRRSELRVLEAAIREAEAEQQFGRSFARGDYRFAARYEREEGNHVILGGFTLTLPMFSKGNRLRIVEHPPGPAAQRAGYDRVHAG